MNTKTAKDSAKPESLITRFVIIQLVVAAVAVGLVGWTTFSIPPLLAQRDDLDVAVKDLETRKSDLEAAVVRAQDSLAELSARTALSVPDAPSSQADEDISRLAAQAAIELQTVLPTAQSQSVDERNQLISQLFDPVANERIAAYQELMARHATDQALIPDLIAYAQAHPDNENGVYNSLVLLSHLDYSKVDADPAQIQEFAEQSRSIGPRTSERVDKLLSRLPESDGTQQRRRATVEERGTERRRPNAS